MGSRSGDIRVSLTEAEFELAMIDRHYQAAIFGQKVPDRLKAKIRHFCVDLRACLEYLAHDIHDRYCPPPPPKKLQFPIFDHPNNFAAQMNVLLPGLQGQCAAVYDIIEGLQPYPGRAANTWLGQLNKLNNTNKHDRFSPQREISYESRTLETQTGGRAIVVGDGIHLDLTNVRISQGDGPVTTVHRGSIGPGGVNLTVTGPEPVIGRITGFLYEFDGVNVPVTELLHKSLAGVRDIVTRCEHYT